MLEWSDIYFPARHIIGSIGVLIQLLQNMLKALVLHDTYIISLSAVTVRS